jgi:hypothetical protein
MINFSNGLMILSFNWKGLVVKCDFGGYRSKLSWNIFVFHLINIAVNYQLSANINILLYSARNNYPGQ